MFELGIEVQADKPLKTQAAAAKRIRLKDLSNAEMVFMKCLGWVEFKEVLKHQRLLFTNFNMPSTAEMALELIS